MSLLLVAVLVPVQAAGCCKLAAILGSLYWAGMPEAVEAPKTDGVAGQATTAHACCPGKKADARNADAKTSAAAMPDWEAAGEAAEDGGHASGTPAQGPASGDCGTGSNGCCLKNAPHADPGLVSAGSGPSFHPPVLHRLAHEPLQVAPTLPSMALPAASGPPVFLACRRLLI